VSSVEKFLPNRTQKWHDNLTLKLRAIARDQPKLVSDARELGEIRREWEAARVRYKPWRERQLEIIVRLRAEGLSLTEIGYTVWMTNQHINASVRRWKELTS
jgi:ATP-dependent exoDNAse (exonuclease V) alpha subunit